MRNCCITLLPSSRITYYYIFNIKLNAKAATSLCLCVCVCVRLCFVCGLAMIIYNLSHVAANASWQAGLLAGLLFCQGQQHHHGRPAAILFVLPFSFPLTPAIADPVHDVHLNAVSPLTLFIIFTMFQHCFKCSTK